MHTGTGPPSLCPGTSGDIAGSAIPRSAISQEYYSKPSPWPTSSACGRCRRIATSARHPQHQDPGHRHQAHVDLSAAIELGRSMEMTFRLPRRRRRLVQVEGPNRLLCRSRAGRSSSRAVDTRALIGLEAGARAA